MAATVRTNHLLNLTAASPPFPRSISGKKVLDQYGNVFLTLTASSWRMANRLTTAEITTAVEGMADAGFNGVTVWCGGTEDRGGAGQEKYLDIDSNNFWTGTPWASTLGPAWAKVDHIADETRRLEMVFNFSFCAGFSTTGAGPDWESATNQNMHDAGVAIATRYPVADYPNLVWHIMFDDGTTEAGTRGQRAQNLFDGINDTEGANARPVRWCEVANGSTTNEQGWYAIGSFACSINSIYEYNDSHVSVLEAEYSEVSGPVGDCEPPYDGSPNAGSSHTGLRYRVASHFIEGGQLINWGHEDWWPFGAEGFFTEDLDWSDVPTHSSALDAGRIFGLVRPHCADTAWAPVSTFVTTGEGTTTSKAAQGAKGSTALAYFPNSRAIQVDTTILDGSGNVRLRWWDPTDGSFSTIAASEAQQTGRSVTHPGNNSNSAGASDYLLVAELA